MQKQLLLFHNAVAGYFSGNQTALDATMKQFAIKVLLFFQSSYPSYIVSGAKKVIYVNLQ